MDKVKCKLPLFVYGTLKRGFFNHVIIQSAEFLGNAQARGILWNLGPFPGFVEDLTPRQGIAPSVKGEVFHTTKAQLADVDTLEGPLYNRRIVEVKLEDGRTIKAWTYELDDLDENVFKYRHIEPTGEWRKGEPIV